MKYILGKKLGMTRLFDKDGYSVGATLVVAGPCYITAIQATPEGSQTAVQIGYQEAKTLNKPQAGHQKKLKTPADAKAMAGKQNPASPAGGSKFKDLKYLREFKVPSNTSDTADVLKIGDKITVDVFKPGDKIKVRGISKGKGFAGVVKRHHFHGGPKTHGSDQHRAPGSIGSAFPQHVFKGKRMAGRMGNERVTVKNLEILEVDAEKNLLVIKGAVPGPKKSLVMIKGTL